jgi:DNA-binding transcriptional LysR family regulator
MEIRQLRYFVAICETGSFSKASHKCFISHQGISLAIMRLENEIGAKLFKRTFRGIEPTDEADFLLPRAIEILRIADECENTLVHTQNRNTALNVWCSYGVIQEFADPIIGDFQKNHSDIHLTITEDTDLACDYALDREEADIAISIAPVDEDKFVAKLLFSKPSCTVAAIVHETHPWAKRDVLQIEDLRDVPLAMMDVNTKTYQQVAALCKRGGGGDEGFEPLINVMVGDILSVFYYAQVNRLVGIAPTSLARRISLPGVVAVPFETQEMAWNGYLLWKKNVIPSKAMELFVATAANYRVIENWHIPPKVGTPA